MNLLRLKPLRLFGESRGAGKRPGPKAGWKVMMEAALPSSTWRGEDQAAFRSDVSSEKQDPLAEPIATAVLCFRERWTS